MIGLVRNTGPSAFHSHIAIIAFVGAAEGCDLLKDRPNAARAFGSSYIGQSKGHAGKTVEQ
ncbi:hypothetical protein [Pseudomonas sp. TH31]|uniref:hypothetical protein n=1 Tax=Pseudomonas sp. TH31 TaxID=2796396 RepID=UPI001914D710|nr:hypothetical protein [Pseudomonas sp. TH31]MBK5417079.1 hypothetical protein [Pseudomonas sp. TH31]